MPGPYQETSPDDLRALIEEQLPRLDRVVRRVASRCCLRGDEVDELRSQVHLRLLENDYRVLRGFSGRCGLQTYLSTVVQNVARDDRIARWGRWRPSAAAEQAGLVAVQLETLLYRDGFSLDEAIRMLRDNHGVRLSHRELVDLAGRLRARTSRREEALDSVGEPAGGEHANGRIRESNRRRTLERTVAALGGALRELPVEDRLILRMHYESGLTIASIATALRLEQRPLYSRRDRCLARLRRALEEQGLEAAEVLEAVGWSAAAFQVPYDPDDPEPGSEP